MKLIPYVILLIFLSFSCKKPAGEGGNSKIEGTISQSFIGPSGEELYLEKAIEKKVYLIYGDNDFYDDDIETDYNGHFEFNYLRKGKYTVYVYEDCATCDDGKSIESMITEIDRNSSKKEINLIANKNIKIEAGLAQVSGNIQNQNYLGNTPVQQNYNAQNEWVYITYESDANYFNRQRTSNQGNYSFEKLIPGNYQVYVYSECPTCSDTLETKSASFTIINKQEVLYLDTLTRRIQQ